MWVHVNILFMPPQDKLALAPSIHGKLEDFVRARTARCEASAHFADKEEGCGCNPRAKPPGAKTGKGVYHSSFVFELAREDVEAAFKEADETVYKKLLERLFRLKCAIRGAIHPAAEEGCSCNVMVGSSVLAAAQRGAEMFRAARESNKA